MGNIILKYNIDRFQWNFLNDSLFWPPPTESSKSRDFCSRQFSLSHAVQNSFQSLTSALSMSLYIYRYLLRRYLLSVITIHISYLLQVTNYKKFSSLKYTYFLEFNIHALLRWVSASGCLTKLQSGVYISARISSKDPLGKGSSFKLP